MSDFHERMKTTSLDDHLAAMTKMVFQSGMGASVVKAKWSGFVEAFAGFDCEIVAGLSSADVDRLCQDTRIIRNRRKIDATIHNARTLLELEAGGGFRAWLAEHPTAADRDKALRREFKFLGPAGIEVFLWMIGETDEVPAAAGAGQGGSAGMAGAADLVE